MGLTEYKRKRRFNETPEPAGKVERDGKRLQFVIQKHHASRLHYDLRLEMDGVMKSWAVLKGPSLRPSDKRLAMHVEDHPIEYNKFEGVIPEGNYGAGKVIIWDRGWYELHREDESWPASLKAGYKKGDLKFILHGQKLQGSFALIKTPHMGDNAWLLIKHKDKYARDEDITEHGESVVSGKDVEEIGADADVWNSKTSGLAELNKLPKAAMPKAVKPMLATLVDEPFDDNDWLYEIKWDGYRAIASWNGKKAELYSRNGNDFSQKYPPIAEATSQLKNKVVLDGEIVAVDENGKAHFEWLQNYGRQPKGQLVYYVFDLLWCNGHDLRDQPLTSRKKFLQSILPPNSDIRYSDHIVGKGRAFFKTAEKQQLEGIMAKNCQSKYSTGNRSKQWLKIKTHLRQEAVIGGFTEPRGSRKYIGALILGVYIDGQLTYVGHTGGGIPTEQLQPLRQRLEKLAVKDSPFANKFKPNAKAHWAKPQLVCEVSFAEWTSDGHMRQPIFVGLRNDKPAKQVTIEKAVSKP